MGYLGFCILLSTIIFIDYKMYIRGENAMFFKDKSEIEINLRKIQKIEIETKLNNLLKKENQ